MILPFYKNIQIRLLSSFFFIVSFILTPSLVFAENKMETKMDHQQEFRFNPGARQGSPLAVNEILQLMSEGSGKLRVFTAYNIDCQIAVRLNGTISAGYTLFLEVDNFSLSGDVNYREFSLTEFMTPPYLDILLRVKTADNRVLKDVALNNIKWKELTPGDSLSAFRINENRINGNIQMDIAKAHFHYGEESLDNITSMKASLSSYYEADKQLYKVADLLETISPEDYERAILDDFKVCEAELITGKVTYAPFWNVLPLNQNDPLHIQARLDTLSTRTKKLRETFNEVLSNLDNHLFETGLDYLAVGESRKALELFERVLVYNPMHIPAHIKLGQNELTTLQPLKAMERFEKLMGKATLPAQWKEEAVDFVSGLFASEISKADEAMEDGRFLDGLNILNEVEKFCYAAEQWECPVLLKEKIRAAHYGMYRSFLSVARRAYSNKNNSFAVLYAESALEYQQNNKEYISTEKETIALLQLIAEGYFSQLSNAFQANDFALALKLAEDAGKLCKKYADAGVICREDPVMLARKAEEYKRSAERMVIPVVLSEPAIMRDDMSREQAAERVKELLSKGHLKAWAGEPAEAREHLNNLMHYVIRYELRKDSVINMRIVSLTEMIAAKECEKTYRDIQSMLTMMNDHVKRGYYSEARQSYDMAREINASAVNCQWSFSDTLLGLSFIELLSEYQQLIHEAQSAYFGAGQKGLEAFIRKYRIAGEFFNTRQLSQYGAEHQSLFEFSAASSNSALVIATIEFLSNDGYHPEVIELFRILERQGFATREMRSLQEYAGAQMASHLYALRPETNPSEFIREKTGNDQWLRNFSRSFTRNWP
ncbi:MAG: hypothetical protein EA361_08735 [Bacteroidetes bacterium]|nr:MAG: hypothetical protein EA361_08735 [Bacteroidota bacterium]